MPLSDRTLEALNSIEFGPGPMPVLDVVLTLEKVDEAGALCVILADLQTRNELIAFGDHNEMMGAIGEIQSDIDAQIAKTMNGSGPQADAPTPEASAEEDADFSSSEAPGDDWDEPPEEDLSDAIPGSIPGMGFSGNQSPAASNSAAPARSGSAPAGDSTQVSPDASGKTPINQTNYNSAGGVMVERLVGGLSNVGRAAFTRGKHAALGNPDMTPSKVAASRISDHCDRIDSMILDKAVTAPGSLERKQIEDRLTMTAYALTEEVSDAVKIDSSKSRYAREDQESLLDAAQRAEHTVEQLDNEEWSEKMREDMQKMVEALKLLVTKVLQKFGLRMDSPSTDESATAEPSMS